MNGFEQIWNWKKHPGSVFLLVVPLASVGLGLSAALALVKLLQGDPWYLVTFAAIAGLGFAAIYRLAKTHRSFMNRLGDQPR